MSTEYAAETFVWIQQVVCDGELRSSDRVVAMRLIYHFNKSRGGEAWPSCETISEAIGLSKATVVRAVERLHQRGHIKVEWGQQGRGRPNHYWKIVKPAPARVLATEEVAPTPVFTDAKGAPVHLSPDEIKGAPVKSKGAPVKSKGARAHLNNTTNNGTPNGVPIERDGGGAAPAGPAPSADAGGRTGKGRKKGEGNAAYSAAASGRDRQFEALAAVLQRPHVSDRTPRSRKAARQAFDAAMDGGASFDTIMAGAKRDAAGADAPRYLPRLDVWLTTRAWEFEPLPKQPRRSGRTRRGNGAVSPADRIFAFADSRRTAS